MNDRQLRYALSVWRAGSFSKAAVALNISQPSISDQIRGLEEEIGFKIFARKGRGVEATHKGQKFLLEANQVVSGLLDLSDTARQLRGGPPISFAIGFSSVIARAVVPEAMAALAPLLTRVRIETITAPTRRILRFVSEERLDAGIAVGAEDMDFPANIICEKFGGIDVVLMVPRGHRLARSNRSVDLGLIAAEPLIAHEADIGYGQQLRNLLAERGLRPNIVALADDAETILLMVTAGAGLALLPETCLPATAGNIVAVPLKPKLAVSMLLVRAARAGSADMEKYFQALRRRLIGEAPS